MKTARLCVLLAGVVLGLIAAPASTSAFSLSNHSAITSSALDFLKPDVLRDLVRSNLRVDIVHPLESRYHFDGCSLQGSTSNIRTHYDAAVSALNPGNLNLNRAKNQFGQLLHTVQDFYSHSNWIEQGKAGVLLDDGLDNWSVITPFQLVQGIVMIQGEDYPPGWSATRSKQAPYPNNAIVAVRTADGQIYRGLITGNLWYEPDDCPDDIAMSHGSLNKDKLGLGRDAQFQQAFSTATLATTHEWCRLVNLVLQEYGQAGVDWLFEQWVADAEKAQSVCKGTY